MAHPITFAPSRCLACGACELACDRQWRISHPDSRPPTSRLRLAVAASRPLGLSCRHCRAAPCLDACPAGAMQRDGNRVFLDTQRCAGCWSCVMVCPIARVVPHQENTAISASPEWSPFAFKCDGCPDEKVAPCVRSCPTGALSVDDISAPGGQTERRRAFAARLLANAGIGPRTILRSDI